MIQSSLIVILLWLPMVFPLDYFFSNGYSTAALTDINCLSVNENSTVFVSSYGSEFFLYTNNTPTSYIERLSVPLSATINAIDVMRDGSRIAVGLNNNQIKVYRYNYTLNTISLNQTLIDATDAIKAIYFSYDKSLLLTGSKDFKGRLYILFNGQYALTRIFTQTAVITTVLISSDNIYIYIGDVTGVMRIYKNSTVGYVLFQTLSGTVPINSASISNDSLYLTIGRNDGKVKVYKLNIGSSTSVTYAIQQTLDQSVEQIRSVSSSYNGQILISSDNLKVIRTYQKDGFGIYSLVNSNLTGLYSKISANSSVILGSNNRVTNVFKNCGFLPNCSKCSSSAVCTDCDFGYFSNSGICESCSSNCTDCIGSPTGCTSCIQGYFVNSGLACQACATGCSKCTATACSFCFDGYYLVGTSCVPCLSNCSSCLNGASCLACASNHYQSFGSCLPCISPCNKCKNISTCTSCINNYYLTASFICSACQNPCLTCNTDKYCTSCVSGYFYTGASCQICPRHCLTCTSESVCTSCNTTFLNTYFDGSTCNFCPYNCTSCSSSSNCLTCGDGFYSDAGRCPKCSTHCTTCSSASVCTNCSSQYFLSSGNCIKCPINCTNCSSSTQCTSCKKGYYLEDSSCLTCSMPGCTYCNSSNICLLCQREYSLVNSVCMNFEAAVDPYEYVKQITLTHNQTLSLIITIVLLVLIIGAGFAVYYWIMQDVQQPKENISPIQRNGIKTEENQSRFQSSQMHLNNSLNLP